MALVGGFVAFVWLAAVYPDQGPSTKLIASAAALAATGPLLAAVSGPTPAILDDARELGPVVQLLPESAANLAAAPLMLLPLLAVATFAVRYRRAEADDRAAMRWPIAGLGVIAALVVAGTLLSAKQQGVVTALFLLGAPVFPRAVAFGPVMRHIDSLSSVEKHATSIFRKFEIADTQETHRRVAPKSPTAMPWMPRAMTLPIRARRAARSCLSCR